MITLENLTKENSNGVQKKRTVTISPTNLQNREFTLNILGSDTNNHATCYIKNRRRKDGRIENETIEIKPNNIDIEDLDVKGFKTITRTEIIISINNNEVGRVILMEDSDLDTDRGITV